MIRTLTRNVTLLAMLGLGLAASNARADFNGSFGLNAASITINGSSINTSTTFTISSFSGDGNTTGSFMGMVPAGTAFSGSTINLASATAFTTSNPSLGTFTETAAPVVTTSSGNVETFYILGMYVGGPVGSTPIQASFTFSMTQTGGSGNSISGSGTMSVPSLLAPSSVPEPASLTMLGLGIAAVGGFLRRRRASR